MNTTEEYNALSPQNKRYVDRQVDVMMENYVAKSGGADSFGVTVARSTLFALMRYFARLEK